MTRAILLFPLLLLSACTTTEPTPRQARALPRVTVLNDGYGRAYQNLNPRPYTNDDGGRLVESTIVLIEAEGATIIMDPGMISKRTDLTDRLAEEGVGVRDVTHVVYSHHHPDHTVNTALFPSAIVVDYFSTYEGDVWLDHGPEYTIAPGVKLLRTPGHTDEDATLIVETPDGVFACTHLWGSAGSVGRPDAIAEDPLALEQNRARILEIADFIVPGHGPMFRNPRR
ncbi:MAG: MBL fold metallo-hydrolase [Planctomycetota bacterium]